MGGYEGSFSFAPLAFGRVEMRDQGDLKNRVSGGEGCRK